MHLSSSVTKKKKRINKPKLPKRLALSEWLIFLTLHPALSPPAVSEIQMVQSWALPY